MAVIQNNDYLEVKAYCYLENQVGINVHYGKILAAGDPGPYVTSTVANDMSTWLAAVIKPLIANDATYLGISLRYWRPGGLNYATVWSKTAAGIGTAGAVPCPKQCSGIMSKDTALAGPANRGRTYVPFPATADVEADGNPTASYLTRLANYAARVDGDENVGGGVDFTVVFGLFRWRDATSFRETVAVTTRDRFATQQRRGDYGRVNAIPPQLV